MTLDRFEDFADVINRNRRANHCWCLSHRLPATEIEQLGGGSRERAMRRLCERDHPPGVVTYRDGEPVGWCNIGPRVEIPRLTRSRLIRPIDDVPVWSIVCLVVRDCAWCAGGGGVPRRSAGPDGPHHGVRRDEGDVRASRVQAGGHH